MLRWLSSSYYSGRGAICDLGVFLGGSTIALADGLRRAGRLGATIHSYDRYAARKHLWQRYLTGRDVVHPDGEDILPTVKDLLSKYLDLVEFHKGDFLEQSPPAGDIEICFVDIAKSLALNDQIVRAYFTKLIPGVSIVVQQDYFHHTPLWDIATMELLSDYFEIIGATEKHSALFLCTRKVDARAVELASSKNFSKDVYRDCITRAGQRWPLATQKVALYRALQVVDGSQDIGEKAWQSRQRDWGPISESAVFGVMCPSLRSGE